MVQTVSKTSPKMTVEQVKEYLSRSEYQAAKQKITKAERTLDEVKEILTKSLYLKEEGILQTGAIEYAAFRVDTLSLIFDLAAKQFRKTPKDGSRAYEAFLRNLGAEVGFTFARDLLHRLEQNDLFLRLEKITDFIELWMSYENDTGAGLTSLKANDHEKYVIQIKNNPLRKMESKPHDHCGFYRYYIRGLLNELIGSRSRILKKKVDLQLPPPEKIFEVVEKPDADGSCVFYAYFREERLTKAFDTLYEAYNQFYSHEENDDYSPCAMFARAALVSAQQETVDLNGEKAPGDLYKAFKGILNSDTYKRMHESYHTASTYVHIEGSSSKTLTKSKCIDLLRDVRRVIIDLELLDLSIDDKRNLLEDAKNLEAVSKLKSLLNNETELSEDDNNIIKTIINTLEKEKGENREKQTKILNILKKAGGRAEEFALPILRNIATEALKKQFDL